MKEIIPRDQFQLNEDGAIQIAKALVRDSTAEQRDALFCWAQELVEIREADIHPIQKAKRAYQASFRSKILVQLLKTLYRELKKIGLRSKNLLWDDRGWPARIALAGITLGAATVGSEGAGIAALGSAIGVPIWLVLGSSGALLGTIVEELRSYKKSL